MSGYEIIDAHVHLHRNITMEKQSFPIPGRRDADRWGNVDQVIPYLDREGISKIVCLNLFPTEPMRKALVAQMPPGESKDPAAVESHLRKELALRLRRHNEWLCTFAKQQPRVVPALGIQKLLTPKEMVEELELRLSQGAKAVKLIPGMYGFYPNDHDFWPMYKRCEELGIPIASDSGTLGAPAPDGNPYGEPRNFIEVLESFPKLPLVMCHLASAFWDERIEMAQRYPNLLFDSSGGFNPSEEAMHRSPMVARDGIRAMPEEDAARVMRKIGIHRIMFGTDGPVHMAQPLIEQVLRLKLTESERQSLLAGNARQIYKI